MAKGHGVQRDFGCYAPFICTPFIIVVFLEPCPDVEILFLLIGVMSETDHSLSGGGGVRRRPLSNFQRGYSGHQVPFPSTFCPVSSFNPQPNCVLSITIGGGGEVEGMDPPCICMDPPCICMDPPRVFFWILDPPGPSWILLDHPGSSWILLDPPGSWILILE